MQSQQNTSRPIAIWLLVAIAMGIWVSPAETLAAEDGLTSRWILIESKEDESKREEAIEGATLDMSRLIRGMATKQLEKATRPSKELRIVDEGEWLILETNEQKRRFPTDGTQVEVKEGKDKGKLQAKRTDEGFILKAQSDSGSQTMTFRLSKDGQKLSIEKKMESDKLAAPVQFIVHYQRDDS